MTAFITAGARSANEKSSNRKRGGFIRIRGRETKGRAAGVAAVMKIKC